MSVEYQKSFFFSFLLFFLDKVKINVDASIYYLCQTVVLLSTPLQPIF